MNKIETSPFCLIRGVMPLISKQSFIYRQWCRSPFPHQLAKSTDIQQEQISSWPIINLVHETNVS